MILSNIEELVSPNRTQMNFVFDHYVLDFISGVCGDDEDDAVIA